MKLGGGWSLIAPPIAATSSRIGMAFDYALRFGLAARGVGDQREYTVAEAGVERLPREMRRSGRERVSAALATLRAMQPTPGLSAEAARASVILTGFDLAFRPGRTDEVEREPLQEDLADVQSLYAVVPWTQFQPKRKAYLNPTFGEGSRAIGGADADLVVDDLLLDVKTTRETRLRSEYLLQILGYALLANAFGIDGAAAGTRIDQVGIYFSRTGRIFSVPLCDILERREHDRVTDYLVRTGKRLYGSSGRTSPEPAVGPDSSTSVAEPQEVPPLTPLAAETPAPSIQAPKEPPRDVAASAISNFMLSQWARVESGEITEATFDLAVSKYAAYMRKVHGA